MGRNPADLRQRKASSEETGKRIAPSVKGAPLLTAIYWDGCRYLGSLGYWCQSIARLTLRLSGVGACTPGEGSWC